MAKTFEERFWRHVVVRGPNDCWLWHGSTGHEGYGRISVKRDGKVRQLAAHRVAWELSNKRELGKRVARHSCDTPSCCNPRHIVPGTQAQNMLDAVERRRLNPSRGEWSPHAKLTDAKVLALREDRAAGMSLTRLVKKYGVSAPVVANVYRGHGWKHVGGPIQEDPQLPEQTRKLTAATEVQLVKEYQAGTLAGPLCEKFNVSRGTMVNILERHGVQRRSPGRPPSLTKKDVTVIRKLYTQRKMSMQLIAERFGVSITAVHRAVHGPYAPQHGIE